MVMKSTLSVLVVLSLQACANDAGPIAVASDAGMVAQPEDAAAMGVCPPGTPFQDTSGKIAVDVQFNGIPMKAIYDTGAPITTIDSSWESKIGDGPVKVDFAAQQRTVTKVQYQSLKGLKIDAVIGNDIVGSSLISIDYPRSVLWMDDELNEANLLACDHLRKQPSTVDIKRSTMYFYAPGKLEGREGYFLIDTGASLGGLDKSLFASLSATKPRESLDGFYTPAGIGTWWASLGMVARMEVGATVVESVVVRTVDDGLLPRPNGDSSFLGLLPHDFFSGLLLTIDFSKKKMRLDAAVNPDVPSKSHYYAAGISLEESEEPPVRVKRVTPKSAAEEQGIVAGDEIVSVRGTSMASLSTYSRPWTLVSKVKDTVQVQVKHDGVDRTVSLELRDLLTVR